MNLLTVSETAKRLGVSTRQVQNLVAQGDLLRLSRGTIDENSVERLRLLRRGSHTRAWSESTAWGAIALLSGSEARWLGITQRSRLKARLRRLSADELAERARGRAATTRYAAHPSSIERIRHTLVSAAGLGARLAIADASTADGYIEAARIEEMIAQHGLVRDDGGTVTLRATSFDLAVVRDLIERSATLSALDLTDSFDMRERRAGIEGLGRAIEALDV